MAEAAGTGTDAGYIRFDTALGRCALGWRAQAVVRFALPPAPLRPHWHGLPLHEGECPDWVAAAVADVQALLRGEHRSLADIAVAMPGMSAFNLRVYELTRAIAPGHTLTYGELARQLGDSAAARAVGKALGENPVPVIVPCHRVLGAGGAMVGFSAPGGVATKRQLLAIEAALRVREGELF